MDWFYHGCKGGQVRIHPMVLDQGFSAFPKPDARTTVKTALGGLRILYKKPYVIGTEFVGPEAEDTQDEELARIAKKLVQILTASTFPQGGTAGLSSGECSVDFAVSGTDFQLRVWKVLAEIPYGKTVSYQWVAEKLGRPKAFRAVGQAVGANPLAWVVPCHRVLPKGGGVGGFRWGSGIKQKLLLLEKS